MQVAYRKSVMQIGAVAKKVGLSVDAIRFYERMGLIQSPPRSAGGFRLYEEAAVETLRFIRRVQHLGFALAEVRNLLALRARPLQPCAPVRHRLRQKITRIRAKLHELRKLEAELGAALRKCNSEARKSSGCPILRSSNGTRVRGALK